MLCLFDQTAFVKQFRCDGISGSEAFFDLAEADLDPLLLKNIGEAALRQTPLQRHLSTFKSRAAAIAGPRFLPLMSTTGRLAEPRTRTSPDTLFLVRRAF